MAESLNYRLSRKVGVMSGDPKECRLRARQCLLQSNRAASRDEQRALERIHRSWNRLAVEIEQAQAFSATLRATELAECLMPNPDGLDASSRDV